MKNAAATETPVKQGRETVLPPATLGVFGSGQLGRMFAQAAQRLGYAVHVFANHPDSPAGQVANFTTVADFSDSEAVTRFAGQVDVITLEFENVPVTTLEAAVAHAPTRPSAEVLRVVQHRCREKRFLEKIGVPCTPFREVSRPEQLPAAVAELGLPAVLKTAEEGYDGKGQKMLRREEDVPSAWQAAPRDGTAGERILEQFVDFQQELSMLVARNTRGEIATCGPIANAHARHILDVSVLPEPSLAGVAAEAAAIAEKIAVQLDMVGLVCVEFFLTTDGRLLVNEIAPRPHNSGHLTLDACVTSQFEQQVRAICGLPLGRMVPQTPSAMANLLGDLWQEGDPCWDRALAIPDVKLHLYGKHPPRPGRKMGHLTALADTPAEARRRVCSARAALADHRK